MEKVAYEGRATGRELYRISNDFARDCANIMILSDITDDRKPERKRAHTVTRAWSIWVNDEKKMYKSFLHYTPEWGYYGCVKDIHGNLLWKSDCYCLASTVRMLISEFMFTLGGSHD